MKYNPENGVLTYSGDDVDLLEEAFYGELELFDPELTGSILLSGTRKPDLLSRLHKMRTKLNRENENTELVDQAIEELSQT